MLNYSVRPREMSLESDKNGSGVNPAGAYANPYEDSIGAGGAFKISRVPVIMKREPRPTLLSAAPFIKLE